MCSQDLEVLRGVMETPGEEHLRKNEGPPGRRGGGRVGTVVPSRLQWGGAGRGMAQRQRESHGSRQIGEVGARPWDPC